MVNFLTPDGDDGDNVYPAGYISGIVDDTPLGTIGGITLRDGGSSDW